MEELDSCELALVGCCGTLYMWVIDPEERVGIAYRDCLWYG